MIREYYYEESTGDSTAADGGVQKLLLSETGVTGDVWFHFFTCSARHEDGDSFEINYSDSAGTLLTNSIQPKDPADYFSCPMIMASAAGADFVQAIMELINTINGIGTDTYHIREASVLALKKHELDQYVGGQGETDTTSSTSYDTLQTLTFTPPTAGDYLIMAVASVRKDTTASNFNIKLVIDGTDYSDATMRSVSINHDQPWFDHAVVNLAASSKTITIQGKVTTSGTLTASNMCIVALRLDTFPWYQTNASRSEATSTSSTYQTPLNPSYRLQTQPMWLISSCLGRRGAASNSHLQRTLYDSTTIQETSNEPAVASGENCHMAQSVFTPSGVEHTTSGQYKTDGAGITVAAKSESVITMVQLEDDATVRILGGAILGATIL